MDETLAIELYESPDGAVRIDVRADGETLWLSQAQMSDLFAVDRDTIGVHLANIYDEGEADRDATTEDFRVVRREGNRDVNRTLTH